MSPVGHSISNLGYPRLYAAAVDCHNRNAGITLPLVDSVIGPGDFVFGEFCKRSVWWHIASVIVVVKNTFRYPDVFFYNLLCRNSLFRNSIMESGINASRMFPNRTNPVHFFYLSGAKVFHNLPIFGKIFNPLQEKLFRLQDN